MKRISLLSIVLALITMTTMAQDDALVTKKGFKILPEQGDIAIGVDFTPFVNGVLATKTFGAPTFNLLDGASIYGKYFLEDDFVIRARFVLNTSRISQENYVDNDFSLDPLDLVKDKGTFSKTQWAIAAGVEKRRGHNRLQGFYGAEIFMMAGNAWVAGNQNSKYEYGNDFTSTNINPTSSTSFNPGVSSPALSRIVESKSGSQIGFGARAFVGVEYFILPKLSIAGEVGWAFAYAIGQEGYTLSESWDVAKKEVVQTKTKTPTGSGFVTSTSSNNGSLPVSTANICIMFHF